MNGQLDPYAVLGVDPTASDAEIREARKALLQLLHPDRQRTEELRRAAESHCKRVNAAFDILGNPQRRAAYDRQASSDTRPPHPFFEPTYLDFGALAPGARRTQTLRLKNDGGPASAAQVLLSVTDSWFAVEVAEAPADDITGMLVLTITAHGPGGEGSLNEWISVTLDGVAARADLRLVALPTRDRVPVQDQTVKASPAARDARPPTPVQSSDLTTSSSAGPIVIALLLLLGGGWLISRILSAPVTAPVTPIRSLAQPQQAPDLDRIEDALPGVWRTAEKTHSQTLQITKDGHLFLAEYREGGRAHRLHGRLLADGRLWLASKQVGKIVNPASFWEGDFSQESWISLSPDLHAVNIAFASGDPPSLVMRRVARRKNRAPVRQPVVAIASPPTTETRRPIAVSDVTVPTTTSEISKDLLAAETSAPIVVTPTPVPVQPTIIMQPPQIRFGTTITTGSTVTTGTTVRTGTTIQTGSRPRPPRK